MASFTCKLKPMYQDFNKESFVAGEKNRIVEPMKQRVSREEICLYQPVANNYKGLHIYPFSCFATEIVTVDTEKVSSIMNIVAMNFLFIKCLLIRLLILGLGIPYSGKIVSLYINLI